MTKHKSVGKSHLTRTSWRPGQSGNPRGRPCKARPAVPDPLVAEVPSEGLRVGNIGACKIVLCAPEKTWMRRGTREIVHSAAMPAGVGWLELGPDGKPVDDLSLGARSSCAWRAGGATAEPQIARPWDWLRHGLGPDDENRLRRKLQ